MIETTDGRFLFAPHNCFACGTLNAAGMGLAIHTEPGRSWTELAVDRRFEGWEGMAHGGILCTILDEVMAWALVGAGELGVTARMSVEFRRPVEIGAAIRAEGWITRSRRRVVDTAARIVDASSGTELATSTGTYLAADATRKREIRARYALAPATTAVHPAGSATPAASTAVRAPDRTDRPAPTGGTTR